MTTHRLKPGSAHRKPRQPVKAPSPWILLARLLGWVAVGFVGLFVIMFVLAMIGVIG